MPTVSLPLGSRAGFWVRTAAVLIDVLVIYALCRGLEAVSIAAHVYLPLELTFAVLWLTYSVLGIVWRGTTLGKAAVGLDVRTHTRGRIGLVRAVLRECLGKLLSALPVFAGFLAAAGADGRAWHDRIAGTTLVRVRRGRKTRLAVLAGLGTGLLIASFGLASWVLLGLEVSPMMSRAHPESKRPLRAAPVDISLVDETGEAECASWLEEHGRPATDFLLGECRRYPVVIVGEKHWDRESLTFLCEMLPELHRSGVRCLAMEWMLAKDDALVERLVAAPVYDPELALEIARHHPWRTWGWKGYVDVLESAWRLNAALGPDEARLRVCGLDIPIDLPSLALAGFGDETVDAPVWERLRAVRMIRELPKALLRDAFMARQVERQVLERGEHALVWVGAAHSTVGCPGPERAEGQARMGYLLARKYPGSITQVYLHDAFGLGAGRPATENAVTVFVERLMEKRSNTPFGWEIAGSPFAALRDPHHWSFGADPDRTFGDLANSYLFLAPRSRLGHCDWLAGYVNERMLTENRPFYEAIGRRAGVEVRDTASADLALSRQ